MVTGLRKWRPAKLPKRLKLKPVVRHGHKVVTVVTPVAVAAAALAAPSARTATHAKTGGEAAQAPRTHAQGACEAGQEREAGGAQAGGAEHAAVRLPAPAARPRPRPAPLGARGAGGYRRAAAPPPPAPAAPPPPPPVPPGRSRSAGKAVAGKTLTASWTGADPATTTYQWQLCDQDGKACQPMPGETNATYVLKVERPRSDRPRDRRLRHVLVDLAGDRSDRAGRLSDGPLHEGLHGHARVRLRRVDRGRRACAARRPRSSASSTPRPIAGRPGRTTSACATSAPTRATTRSHAGTAGSPARSSDRSGGCCARSPRRDRSTARVVIGQPIITYVRVRKLVPVVSAPSAAIRRRDGRRRPCRTATTEAATAKGRSRSRRRSRRRRRRGAGRPGRRERARDRHGHAGRSGGPGRRQRDRDRAATGRQPVGRRARDASGDGHRARSTPSCPSIIGVPQSSKTISADPGTWTGTPTSFTYQWQRCDAAGANCVVVGSGQSYTCVPADIDKTMRVAVEATNAAGSAIAVSAASPKTKPS